MFPATLVYVNAGTQLARIHSLSGILSPGLLGAFVLLGVFPLLAKKVANALSARKIYARWQKPRQFDRNLVVIGGASTGLVTAYTAAVKAKFRLVEKHAIGGDCLNTGCVLSKALIRSAKLLSPMARSREFDVADVMQRVQDVIAAVTPHDSAARYMDLGVDIASSGCMRAVRRRQGCPQSTAQRRRRRRPPCAASGPAGTRAARPRRGRRGSGLGASLPSRGAAVS